MREPDFFRKMLNVDVLTEHRAELIVPIAKGIEVKNLKTNQTFIMAYDRLVIAVGASQYILKFEVVNRKTYLP